MAPTSRSFLARLVELLGSGTGQRSSERYGRAAIRRLGRSPTRRRRTLQRALAEHSPHDYCSHSNTPTSTRWACGLIRPTCWWTRRRSVPSSCVPIEAATSPITGRAARALPDPHRRDDPAPGQPMLHRLEDVRDRSPRIPRRRGALRRRGAPRGLPGHLARHRRGSSPQGRRHLGANGAHRVRAGSAADLHGVALNVEVDLSMFGHIVPCGIAEFPVTSLRDEGLERHHGRGARHAARCRCPGVRPRLGRVPVGRGDRRTGAGAAPTPPSPLRSVTTRRPRWPGPGDPAHRGATAAPAIAPGRHQSRRRASPRGAQAGMAAHPGPHRRGLPHLGQDGA